MSIATITVVYMSQEKYFYFWDYANYSDQTSELASAFHASIIQGLRTLKGSLVSDYNKLPCLPLVPFFLIFGNSRLVYILSSALAYVLPFSLVMGAIATRIIPVHPFAVFWSTAFLTLLIPPTWASSFRGYPDIGGAVIMGLAVLVYLKNVRLKCWWQIPLIGFLLALAILFRRHFAYSARAFIGATILEGLALFFFEVRQNRKRALQNLTRYGILIVLVALSSFLTLIVLAPTFTHRVLTTDFRSLYSSYEQSISANLLYYGTAFGWLTWFLAILGFSSGIVTRLLVRPDASFIIVFGSLSVIQWVFFSRQLGIHYTTHFTFFIALGISVLVWTVLLILNRKARFFLLTACMVFLTSNIVIGLTTLGSFDNSFRPLFSQSSPPLMRKDYDEFTQLIEFLREVDPDKQPIFIAASSGILNQSLVKEGEKQLHGESNSILNVVWSPDIDSRDVYPLEGLLNSQYVILASPFQYHIAPEEQKVVKVTFDAFTNNWEFARDFKRLPKQFTLDENVIVSIFQRTRPTSLETTLRTLKSMQNQIKSRPGSQSDWMILSRRNNSYVEKNPDESVNININKKSTISALYFGSIPTAGHLSGDIDVSDSRCGDFSLRLTTLNAQGNVINNTELTHSFRDLGKFSLPLRIQDATYLLLDFVSHDNSQDIDRCSAVIKNLQVSSRD